MYRVGRGCPSLADEVRIQHRVWCVRHCAGVAAVLLKEGDKNSKENNSEATPPHGPPRFQASCVPRVCSDLETGSWLQLAGDGAETSWTSRSPIPVSEETAHAVQQACVWELACHPDHSRRAGSRNAVAKRGGPPALQRRRAQGPLSRRRRFLLAARAQTQPKRQDAGSPADMGWGQAVTSPGIMERLWKCDQ